MIKGDFVENSNFLNEYLVYCALTRTSITFSSFPSGLGSLFLSSLDAKLVPEHLLCLCLEHEQTIVSSRRSACKYNFYKVLQTSWCLINTMFTFLSHHILTIFPSLFQDSNAPSMAKMVNKLTPVQQHILSLLNEWEDHHGLQKILDVIKMLLNIPFSTPLAKVE